VTAGRITLAGEDVTDLPTDARAARGLFLGFQHPEAIPGLSVLNFLRQALAVRRGIADLSVLEVRMDLMRWSEKLGMDDRFTQRYLNEGFSGGERKRNEILQMALMEPVVAVLDETDSSSPTTGASSTSSRPTSSTSCSTAASCGRAGSSSPSGSSVTGSMRSGSR
jgi:Fe-S cluster assembly ATP-binding protein